MSHPPGVVLFGEVFTGTAKKKMADDTATAAGLRTVVLSH